MYTLHIVLIQRHTVKTKAQTYCMHMHIWQFTLILSFPDTLWLCKHEKKEDKRSVRAAMISASSLFFQILSFLPASHPSLTFTSTYSATLLLQLLHGATPPPLFPSAARVLTSFKELQAQLVHTKIII